MSDISQQICAPERGRLGSELSLPPLEDAQFFPYSSGDVVGEQSPFDDMVRRWSDHFAACGGNRVSARGVTSAAKV